MGMLCNPGLGERNLSTAEEQLAFPGSLPLLAGKNTLHRVAASGDRMFSLGDSSPFSPFGYPQSVDQEPTDDTGADRQSDRWQRSTAACSFSALLDKSDNNGQTQTRYLLN